MLACSALACFCMIFLSSFPAGLSVALLDCFFERRITYIMYTLGVLCIVCARVLPVVFRWACGGGIFWRAEQWWEGWQQGEKMLVPTLHPCEKSG